MSKNDTLTASEKLETIEQELKKPGSITGHVWLEGEEPIPLAPDDKIAHKLNELLEDDSLEYGQRKNILRIAKELGFATTEKDEKKHEFDLGSLMAKRLKDPDAYQKFVQLQEVDRRRTEDLRERNRLLQEEVELMQKLGGRRSVIDQPATIHERQMAEVTQAILDEGDSGDKVYLVHKRDGRVVASYELSPREKTSVSLWARIKGWFR